MCSCAGKAPEAIPNELLRPCPVSPNCVSSDATDSIHRIAPLSIGDDAEASWAALVTYVETDPALTITINRDGYLRAEARTRLLRFVDDVEFQLRPAEHVIAVRSASRLGLSDLGANRRRIETIRSALQSDQPRK